MRHDAASLPSAAEWQPHVVALVCNWCTYAGADLAGTTRLTYPATVRIVRFPCTGRIDPLHVVRAFEQGADGVLVSGCHPGDCHYVQGNLIARRRAAVLRALMEFLGLDDRRLHFSWVSAAEGAKWARVVDEVTIAVREAGPLARWGAAPAAPDASPDFAELPAAPRSPPPAAGSETVTRHLRDLAATLLDDEQVTVVLGHIGGPVPGRMAPAFVTSSEEAGALSWNERCFTNLATYLPRLATRGEKVAAVVRQCDMRAVVGLLQEGQIQRENLVLIGIRCQGAWEGDSLARRCYACDGQAPVACDHVIGSEGAGTSEGEAPAITADPRDDEIAVLEGLAPDERWRYWQRQLARCLRCYACRAVCALCYCSSCISEKNRPQLVSPAIDGRGNTAWNIVRAFHLAGRCIGCDECARVCPADIRLDLINRRLALEVESRYGYRPGESADVAPALTLFHMDDAEEFIL